MVTPIPQTDPRRDGYCYWFLVSQFRAAARIEGRSPSHYDDIDSKRLMLQPVQEAAPDRDIGMAVAEEIVARDLRVESIDCFWSPAVGTLENPKSMESLIFCGDKYEAPGRLSCFVTLENGAWKARFSIWVARDATIAFEGVEGGGLLSTVWEACHSLEDAVDWCENECAQWLHVNSIRLSWEHVKLPVRDVEYWKADVSLRHR